MSIEQEITSLIEDHLDTVYDIQDKSSLESIIRREVENEEGEIRLRLHGHTIAKSNAQGLFVSNAGWTTNTTKERLNGIHGVSIHQSDFIWYLNGEEMPSNEYVKVG